MFDSIMDSNLMDVPGTWVILVMIGFINLCAILSVFAGRPHNPDKWRNDSRSDSPRTSRLTRERTPSVRITDESKYKFNIIRREAK